MLCCLFWSVQVHIHSRQNANNVRAAVQSSRVVCFSELDHNKPECGFCEGETVDAAQPGRSLIGPHTSHRLIWAERISSEAWGRNPMPHSTRRFLQMERSHQKQRALPLLPFCFLRDFWMSRKECVGRKRKEPGTKIWRALKAGRVSLMPGLVLFWCQRSFRKRFTEWRNSCRTRKALFKMWVFWKVLHEELTQRRHLNFSQRCLLSRSVIYSTGNFNDLCRSGFISKQSKLRHSAGFKHPPPSCKRTATVGCPHSQECCCVLVTPFWFGKSSTCKKMEPKSRKTMLV